MKKHILSSFVMISTLGLGACSLPNSGPTVGAVSSLEDNHGVNVVKLDESQVIEMAKASNLSKQTRLDNAIAILENSGDSIDRTLSVGDIVAINLWTFSPWPGGASDSASSGQGGPSQVKMGDFQISSDGTVDLPYAHRVHIAGMTYPQAQDAVASRYSGLGILQRPAVTIQQSDSATKVGDGGNDGVLVTGQIGKPRDIPWSPGGLTMAKALTFAMGDGTTTLESQSEQHSNSQASISVSVSRNGHSIASIPMDEALERDIPLRPADHLIVKKQSSVRVNVMGGGIMKNGVYGFADTPSMAEVISSAQGLNTDTANSSKIYVFRLVNNVPTLYELNWTKGISLFVAQQFPIQDQDIVYVAESQWVPVEKVLSLIVQMGVVASIAR